MLTELDPHGAVIFRGGVQLLLALDSLLHDLLHCVLSSRLCRDPFRGSFLLTPPLAANGFDPDRLEVGLIAVHLFRCIPLHPHRSDAAARTRRAVAAGSALTKHA